MFLPIDTVGRDKQFPIATVALIVINAIVFAWEMLYMQANGEAAFTVALMNITFNFCEVGQVGAPQLALDGLRSMFLHGSLLHIAGNMMFLWVFGRKVEQYFGFGWYVVFYLIAGYMAILGHGLLGGITCTVGTEGLIVGASGAVAGVMGAFLFLHPDVKIKALVATFTVRIPAIFYLVFWFMMDFVQGIGWYAAEADNVARWAHVAGFLFGFVLVFITTMFIKPAPKADPFAYLDEI